MDTPKRLRPLRQLVKTPSVFREVPDYLAEDPQVLCDVACVFEHWAREIREDIARDKKLAKKLLNFN